MKERKGEMKSAMKSETDWMELFIVMYAMNFCVLCFYSAVCLSTTYRICHSFEAYSFLSSVRQMPAIPWKMPVRSGALYLALGLVSFGKYRWRPSRVPVRFLICAAEIALCLGVIVSANCYYSGAALLVMADLVHYVQDSRRRILFIAALMLIFALGRFEVAFPFTTRIPFSAYLNYYSQSARGWLSAMESLLVALNILLFVYAMILLFTGQKEETIRISRLNEQLRRANDRLRENAVELERAAEIRERNRLAREIHDTLGHTLTGIIMGLEAVLVISETAPEDARGRVAGIIQTAREGLNDVRSSMKALRPDALKKHGLEEALGSLIDNFRLTTSVEIHFSQQAGPLLFASDEEDTLYRIIQEGMTNAVQHGHATEIEITVTKSGGVVTVTLKDNGQGSQNLAEGFGLRHMEERLGLLGGSLTYGNRDLDSDDARRGFLLTASLPVREREVREREERTEGI